MDSERPGIRPFRLAPKAELDVPVRHGRRQEPEEPGSHCPRQALQPLKQPIRATLVAISAALAGCAVLLSGQSSTLAVILIAFWGIAFGTVPVAWSTWLARTVADEAESGGALLVAAIQIAIASRAGHRAGLGQPGCLEDPLQHKRDVTLSPQFETDEQRAGGRAASPPGRPGSRARILASAFGVGQSSGGWAGTPARGPDDRAA